MSDIGHKPFDHCRNCLAMRGSQSRYPVQQIEIGWRKRIGRSNACYDIRHVDAASGESRQIIGIWRRFTLLVLELAVSADATDARKFLLGKPSFAPFFLQPIAQ